MDMTVDTNAFYLIYYMLAEYFVLTLAISPPPSDEKR